MIKASAGKFAGIATLALLAATTTAGAATPAAPEILRTRCGACHLDGGQLQRILNLRKSPEGWDMSIARMGVWHKVDISKDERRALVKYLADTRGLAPAEAAPYRFLLERVPNSQDVTPNDELAQMCGRCHSYGRVALQRRDSSEWTKLVHTHLGQFPSIEYSALGRDRNWKEIALTQTAPQLGRLYPLDSADWKAWQAKKKTPPTGLWRVTGYRPGWGDYAGYMTVEGRGGDRYAVRYELDYAAGNRVAGRGESVVYTGYEWRGDARLGNQDVRSVFALDADGRTMSGRWFLRHADEIGASFRAVKADAPATGTLLAVVPATLRAGDETKLSVHGVRIGTDFDAGPGITVLAARRKSAHEVELTVRVAADAATGNRKLRAKGSRGEAALAVYRQFDSVRVEPDFAVARIGGGTNAPLTAQFDAIAYLNGADGQPGTADDIRLGRVEASWTTDNHDERARQADDASFAGAIDPRGLFVPAAAGPNPARKGMNNVGDLAVIARIADGERAHEAKAHLMVTVQRWNTPPLR